MCVFVCVCLPARRGFVRRCVGSESSNEDSFRRANRCLDRILHQGVQELTEKLYQQIKVGQQRSHAEVTRRGLDSPKS